MLVAVGAAFVEGTILVEVLDSLAMITKMAQTLYQIKDGQVFRNPQVHIQENDPFYQRSLYQGEIMSDAIFSQIMGEKILEIQRWCQSTWDYIPSGLASIFTWTFTGNCVRQEYLIIITTNNIALMEMVRVGKDEEERYIMRNEWWKYENDAQKKEIIANINRSRSYDRCLSSYKLPHNFQVGNLIYFISILLQVWKSINDKDPKFTTFDPCRRVSKLLARSILYFSKEEPDYNIVLQSIFGCFTDKPMFIPHLDLILVEKAVWHGQKLSEERKKKLIEFTEIIHKIRTTPIG